MRPNQGYKWSDVVKRTKREDMLTDAWAKMHLQYLGRLQIYQATALTLVCSAIVTAAPVGVVASDWYGIE